MAIERTMSVPLAQPRNMRMLVGEFKKKALPNTYSLGQNGKKVFGFGLLTMVGLANPSLVAHTAVSFAVGKIIGRANERRIVGQIAELSKQPGETAELLAEMETLDFARDERLTAKLEKQGVNVRTISQTVASYKELYAKPRLWSLGAGRQLFNKVWLGALAGAIAWPALAGAQAAAAALAYIPVLFPVAATLLFIAAKVYGRVMENRCVAKLAGLIKSNEDKSTLLAAIKEQEYPQALQDRLIAKLSRERRHIPLGKLFAADSGPFKH